MSKISYLRKEEIIMKTKLQITDAISISYKEKHTRAFRVLTALRWLSRMNDLKIGRSRFKFHFFFKKLIN